MAQFEALVRAEAAGFWIRRRAASLLQRALGEEQAGVGCEEDGPRGGGGGGVKGMGDGARKKGGV